MYNPSESKLDTISWEDLEKEFPEITKSAVYHEAEKHVCENEIDKRYGQDAKEKFIEEYVQGFLQGVLEIRTEVIQNMSTYYSTEEIAKILDLSLEQVNAYLE